MAKNAPTGDNARRGQVTGRSQTFNPSNGHWTKRDTATGQFMDQKADSKPFKGVRRER
jgi:V8-like Glu-specific endopeptidase